MCASVFSDHRYGFSGAELRVFVTVPPGIVRKNLLLIGDGIGFLGTVIVHRQPAISGGNLCFLLDVFLLCCHICAPFRQRAQQRRSQPIMSAVKCRLYGAVQKQGPELLQDALPAAAVKMRAHLVFGAADIHSEIVSMRSP